MLSHFNSILHSLLLTISILGLVACGGGSGDSLPAINSTPAKVISTNPASEDTGIRTGTIITVTFNEDVETVLKGNIDIFPVLNGSPQKDQQVLFKPNTNSKTLTIEPETGALMLSTIYEITITDVKTIRGVSMIEACKWKFETEGSITPSLIGQGLTGVCGIIPQEDPLVEQAKDVPQNVTAIDGTGNSIIVSWDHPVTGAGVKYYIINRSARDGIFIEIATNVNKISFTDTSVLRDNFTSYVYQVTAVMNSNESKTATSNRIILK